MITHKVSVDMSSPSFPVNSPLSLQEQHDTLRQLRREMLLRYRPVLQRGSGPIRVMARMVSELEKQCRDLNFAEEVMQTEIVNRTIGDVNLRRVTEFEDEPGGPGDYRLLAEELGIACPMNNCMDT